MKLLICLFLICTDIFSDPAGYTYEVNCGADAHWVDGKNYCNVHNESVFITSSYEGVYETYSVFQIKIQNISNDTILIDPQQFLLVREFEDAHADTVPFINAEKEILKATTDVTKHEKEISDLNKINKTENDLANTVRLFARNTSSNSTVANTSSNAKSVLYQEQLKIAQTKLAEATKRKNYWTSEALRKNTLQPYNYLDKKIWASTQNCAKAYICIRAGASTLRIPFIRVTQ